jgi:putative sigma-54 modulation protein
MKIKIFGKNIEVTEGIRSAVEEKIGKLDKYFAEETRVDVTQFMNNNPDIEKEVVNEVVKKKIDDEMGIVLPKDRIISASRFSIEVFNRFNIQEEHKKSKKDKKNKKPNG